MGMVSGSRARVALIVVALSALAALPAIAEAKPIPGGAADQYTEGIPQAGGQRESSEKGNGSLPPGAEAQLQAQGKAGSEAANLAKATAPGPSDSSSDPSDGMGIVLPLILGAALLAAIALFLARRRQAATSG